MPSIAQQDYLKISCQGTRDCHLLAAIAHNVKQGTLFETVISIITGDGRTFFTRPDAYRVGQMGDVEVALVYFKDPSNPDFEKAQIYYNQTQYEGLAAIQDAINVHTEIPSIDQQEHGLFTHDSDNYVCVNGKYLVPEISEDDKLLGITISEESPAAGTDFINISWEDAQKLIGVSCPAL